MVNIALCVMLRVLRVLTRTVFSIYLFIDFSVPSVVDGFLRSQYSCYFIMLI